MSSAPSPAAAPSPKLKIAVVGLGGIGGAACGLLAQSGLHDVTACVRKPLERLFVEGPDGTFDVALNALTDPADAQPVDWVLLATKTHETASAGAFLKRLCTPATKVAALQNGIDHEERIAPYVNGASIVPALVYYNGERLAPDRVRYKPVSEHALISPDTEAGRAFAALMSTTPLTVLNHADFVTVKWRKLLVNAISNPITALTLQRFIVFERPDVQALSLAVLDEAGRVARADGAHLHDDESRRVLATVRGFGVELSTSTYFDRLAGRPFEVEALTGAIVAAGERHGIATPLNGLFLTLLRAISESNAKA